MSKKQKKVNEETILIYPNFPDIFRRRRLLEQDILLIIQDAEYNLQNVDSSEKWKTKKDKEEAKKLYGYFIKHMETYYNEYMFVKQWIDSGKEDELAPKIVSVFKKIMPMIKERNVGVVLIPKLRLKAFKSFLKKLITNIENRDYKKLDSYFDIFAARIIIQTNPIRVPLNDENGVQIIDSLGVPLMKDVDSPESLQLCYDVANSICILMDGLGHKPIDAKFKDPVSDKIYPKYQICMKDYIFAPKSNNYASLHILFNLVLEDNSEIPIEIQVRTDVMDYDADNSLLDDGADSLSHNKYKQDRIKLGINANEINIVGYRAQCVNGVIVKEQDFIGFNNPIFL